MHYSSLIQICDLIANKPIKQAFKKRYVSWKIASHPGPGGKYKVDRKDVISWLEPSIEDVNVRMSTRSEVARPNTRRTVFIAHLSTDNQRYYQE
jgi:hypothetical protein